MNRRKFLTTTAVGLVAFASGVANARSISGSLPWEAFAGDPPTPVTPGGWHFFNPREVVLMEAIVDRLIPADDLSIGGKDAGCVVYIDRQLAGSYGDAARALHAGAVPARPANAGLSGLGRPRPSATAHGLTAVDKICQRQDGRPSLRDSGAPSDQDAILKDLEAGKLGPAETVDGKAFFALMLQQHHGRLLRRPDLRRQPGHGVLEDDRLSRRALRLPRHVSTSTIEALSASCRCRSPATVRLAEKG